MDKRETPVSFRLAAARGAAVSPALFPLFLLVKAVPGASRSRVAGRYGQGVKVQVPAAPEQGKANAAVIGVLAQWLNLKPARIELVAGHGNPRKQFRISGITSEILRAKIAELP